MKQLESQLYLVYSVSGQPYRKEVSLSGGIKEFEMLKKQIDDCDIYTDYVFLERRTILRSFTKVSCNNEKKFKNENKFKNEKKFEQLKLELY